LLPVLRPDSAPRLGQHGAYGFEDHSLQLPPLPEPLFGGRLMEPRLCDEFGEHADERQPLVGRGPGPCPVERRDAVALAVALHPLGAGHCAIADRPAWHGEKPPAPRYATYHVTE